MQSPLFSIKKAKLLALAIASCSQAVNAPAWASPEGGQVVAGQGAIEQLEKETRIQQSSERLSIDWKNFDIGGDERVQFIQPNSSSIAFNRILSSKGSLIQGRIDANGQVVLINPNGLIFTEGASVNAGGLIASALQMSDQDYLNGKFTLNALEGSEGRVVNSGLLNAATGGNISLLGQSIENKGLISAQLGSINLAAGKEAVLTFEPNGLVGVRVTEAVLQKDLGVDAAVINSGEIKAEGGKVLITASTSRDIFSKAVNIGELSAAKSAVVNEDGSFTLGAGADVKNSGTIDVSSHGVAGEAVLIGNNISHRGRISADSETTNAGKIELNANNISEVTGEAVVTAVAQTQGKGGDIKLLGDKVGIFNNAKVDASGANGGGQVLLGGDQTGANPVVNNAQFLFVEDKAEIQANATLSGDGGRLIAFAEEAARIYGQFDARGSGDGFGGFVETSGLNHLDLTSVPNVGGAPLKNGLWLIDPANITINTGSAESTVGGGTKIEPYTNPTQDGNYSAASIGANTIRDALNLGGDVYIKTGRTTADITVPDTDGNITVNATSITTTRANDVTLYLDAGRNITFSDASNYTFALSNTSNTSRKYLSLDLLAGGNIDFKSATIITNGGNFTATASTGKIDAKNATINTSAATGGGDIKITATAGAVDLGAMNFSYPVNQEGVSQPLTQVGSVEVNAGGTITFNKELDFNNTAAYKKDGSPAWAQNYPQPTADDPEKSSLRFTSNNGSITFNANVYDSYGDKRDALTVGLTAAENINFNYSIFTSGGDFTAQAKNIIMGQHATTNPNSIKFSIINTDLAHDANSDTGSDPTDASRSEGGSIALQASQSMQLKNGSLITDSTCIGPGNCAGNLLLNKIGTNDAPSVTHTGLLTVHGETHIEAGSGDVSLTGTGNVFGDNKTLSIIAKKTNIRSSASLLLGNITSDDLTLVVVPTNPNTSGSITQQANSKIIAPTVSELLADTVQLDQAGNNFGTIEKLTANKKALITETKTDAEATAAGALFHYIKTPELTLSTQGAAQLNGLIDAAGSAATSITQNGAGEIALGDNLVKVNAVTFNGVGALHYAGADKADWDVILKTVQFKNDAGRLFNFNAFTALIGGDGIDIFSIKGAIGAALPTLIGGKGDNSLVIAPSIGAGANNDWQVKLFTDSQSFDAASLGIIQCKAIKTLSVTDGVGGINNTANTQLTLAADGSTEWTLTSATPTYTLKNDNLNTAPISFNGFKQLSGGAGKDTFNYSADNTRHFVGTLNGGAGSDVLGKPVRDEIKGLNTNTTWDLSGAQQKFITSAETVNFSEIETLTGTTQGSTKKDTVKLSDTITAVDLGGAAFSSLTLNSMDVIQATAPGGAKLTGYTASSTWDITGTNSGNITDNANATEFTGFSELISSNADANKDIFTVDDKGTIAKITGQAGDTFKSRTDAGVMNNWTIQKGTSTDSKGNQLTIANINTVYATATGFGTVIASTGNDTFNFDSGVTAFSGALDANTGTNTVNANSIAVDFASGTIGGITQVSDLNAIGNNPTLTVNSNQAVTWDLFFADGVASLLTSTVSDATHNLKFTGFTQLNGGNQDDTFNLDKTPTNFNLSVNGGVGAGINTLFNADKNSSVWDLDKGTLRGLSFSQISQLTGSGSDSISGPNTDNTWNFTASGVEVTAPNSPTAPAYHLSGFTQFTGGSLADTFNIKAESAATTNATLNGGDGANSYILDANISGTLTGGKDADTFAINTATAAHLNGGDGIDVFNVNAKTTGKLSGGTDADIFKLTSADNIATGLDGGEGADTLQVASGNNNWSITKLNEGSLNTQRFSGIETLIGGTGVDIFTFSDTGTVTSIDGGSNTLATDKDQLINQLKNQTFVLSGMGAGSLQSQAQTPIIAANVNGIEKISGVTELKGPDAGAATSAEFVNWKITGSDQGTIKTATIASLEFDGVANLAGGTANDIFDVSTPGAKLSGLLNGGAGVNTLAAPNAINIWKMTSVNAGAVAGFNFSDIQTLKGGTDADTLDYSVIANGTISAAELTSIEEVKGDGATTVLLAGNNANKWSLTAADTGTLNTTLAFSGIATLQGGTGKDEFIVADNSTFAGTLAGGSALAGAQEADSIALVKNEGVFTVTEQGAGTLKIIHSDASSTQLNFSQTEQLVGGINNDTFNINKSVAMVLNGGAGTDAIKLPPEALTIGISLTDTPTSGGLTLANFEKIDASVNSTLRAVEGTATWNITGANAGFLTLENSTDKPQTTQFSGFANLIGSTGADTFNFNKPDTDANGTVHGSLSGTLSGNGGSDILIARDAANEWTINAAGAKSSIKASGEVEPYVADFSAVNELRGGSKKDQFIINGTHNNVIIKGGEDNDTFTLNDSASVKEIQGNEGVNTLVGRSTGAINWVLSAANQGVIKVGSQDLAAFSGIQTYQGRSATDTVIYFNSLVGAPAIKHWSYENNLFTVAEDNITLAGMDAIKAGSDADTVLFKMAFNGSFDAGAGKDTFSMSAGENQWLLAKTAGSGTLTQGVNVNNFAGFEVLNGGSGNDTLSAANSGSGNDWTITGETSGSLSTTSSVEFTQMENLLGADGNADATDANDTFTFAQDAKFLGLIDGRGGNNLVSVFTTGTYTLDESGIGSVKNATGVKNTADDAAKQLATLKLSSAKDSQWFVNGENKGEFTYAGTKKFTFNGFGILEGGSGADSFDLTALGASINKIDGSSGQDTLLGKSNTAWVVGGSQTLKAGDQTYVNDFKHFEILTATTNSSLAVAQGSVIWDLTGTNTQLTHTLDSVTQVITFAGFNTLLGSEGKDIYMLGATELVGLTIDGRGGENLVQLKTEKAELDLTQNLDVQGVKNVTGVSGNGDAATLNLNAKDTDNVTWTLTDKNSGSLSFLRGNQPKSISFAKFVNLTGGDNNDTFILQGNGVATGVIKGGAGLNNLTAWSDANAKWDLGSTAIVGLAPTSSVTNSANTDLTQKFSGITTLNGSLKDDLFIVAANPTFIINAGDGDDTLRLRTTAILDGQFKGGAGKNTVEAVDGVNNWQLNSLTSGSLTSRVQFTDVNTLVGGAGIDTLNGINVAASWDVNKSDGSVAAGAPSTEKLNFQNMDTLVGGTQSDAFKVRGAFAGTINAGDGNDSLEILSGGTLAVFNGGGNLNAAGDSIIGPVAGGDWQLNADKNTLKNLDGAVLVGDFQNVETLQADAGASDRLISTLADNSWELNAVDAGRINTAINFTGFDRLKGSDQKDTFIFNFAGSFGKEVDAGLGDNSVQLKAVNAVVLDWNAKNVNGVKGANKLIGSNTVDSELSLVSTAGFIWTIDRLDGGSVQQSGSVQPGDSDVAAVFNFDQFKNIKGSAVSDDIRFINAGRISGNLDAGDGVDSVQGLDRENNWQLGQRFTVTAAGDNSPYIGNAAGFERLIGGSKKDTFAVYARINADITGGDGDDRLVVASAGQLAGSFSGNGGVNSVESQLAASRWELTSTTDGVIFNGDEKALTFNGVNNLSALQSGDNQLSFAAVASDLLWSLNDGSNERASGQVEIASQVSSRTKLAGFNHITGAKGADDITLSTAITDINLGDGDNRLTVQAGAKVASVSAGKGTDELKSFASATLWQMLNGTQGKLSSASAEVVSQYSGFEQFTGTGSDRLSGAPGTNKWVVNGPAAGTLNSAVTFTGFAYLQGNTGNDTFEIGIAGAIGNLDGGEGDDNLIARNSANQWSFIRNDAGSIHAPNEVNYLNFTGIENFTGATLANDSIAFDPQVTNVKLNAGGQAGDELIVNYRDSLNLASDGATWLGVSGLKKVKAQALTVNHTAQLSSTASGPSRWTINEENGGDWATGTLTTHFSGFDEVLGSAAADEFVLSNGRISSLIDGGAALNGEKQNDSLVGEDYFTRWTITSSGSGSLVDEVNRSTQTFAGIETVQGGGANDEFKLSAEGIAINIRGGNSNGIDTITFAGALDITLGQQDVVGVGIKEIEFFTADKAYQNTLRSSADAEWTLSGENSGTLVSDKETLNFSNFQNLRGGKGDDVFNLNETARVSGELSGGEGNNTLNLNHNREITATLSADGAGELVGNQAIARFSQIRTLSLIPQSANVIATLNGAKQSNDWLVSDDYVKLNGYNYTGFTRLNGSDESDNFVFDGKQTLSIDGKNGSDSLSIKSNDATQVNWQLTGAVGVVSVGTVGGAEIIAPKFANIEQLIGGDGDDSFNLSGATSTYGRFDGAAGNNTLTAHTATNQWRLGALLDDGSAALDHLNTAEVLNIQTLNGAGSDTLISSDDKHFWQLSRGGNLSLTQSTSTQSRAITATGIGQIKGGKGQDDFVLVKSENDSRGFARMDGGTAGDGTSSVRDSLDARAINGDVQVNLNTIPDATIIAANQLVVSGVEFIQLNSAKNNSLYGPTLADNGVINWQITPTNTVSLAPAAKSNVENSLNLTGVNNIYAGRGEDRFTLSTTNAISGELDGGDGDDYLDYSKVSTSAAQNSFDVEIGEDTRFKNIEGVIGKNGSGMNLVAKGDGSQWQIQDVDGALGTSDGVNDGLLVINQKTIKFIDFASLVGTDGVDSVTIDGSFNGKIDLKVGADSVTVKANPNLAQAISLLNDSTDTLTLNWVDPAAPPAGVKETYKLSDGSESIILESINPSVPIQPFKIDFTALASIDDTLAVDEMRVQTAFKNAGSNLLSLTQNALQLATPSGGKVGTRFNVENKTNLVLSGQTGDQLSLSGTSQFAGALTIEKFAINALGEQSLGAGQITFSGVASIGDEQNPVVIATPLVQFNNLRGDAWLKSRGDIKLASLEGQGKLNLSADGQIGQTQLLTYARDLNLTANGAITLDNPDNRLTGGLSLQSGNAIKLANGLTQINSLSAENFTFTGQDLTAEGPLVVAGSTDLTSTGSISAVNLANRLPQVRVNAAGSTSLAVGADSKIVGAKVGGALRVQADGLEVVGDISAASLDLTAGQPTSGAGQLKISGQLNAPIIALTAGDLVLKTQLQAGQLSLNAKSVSLEKSINLTGDFSAQVDTLQQGAEAAIASKGALTINADGALQLNGALSSERGMAITAGGTIQQSGAWRTDLTGTSGETKPASADVVVKSAGSIIQQASASTQSSGGITYEAAGEIRLSALSAKGEVFVNATGGIEDVNGTATNITAPSVRLISGGNINGLDLSVDSLIGQFAGAAKTIDLRNDKTLRIDRLVNNSSGPDVVTTIATARGDVIFNNDASKNPEVVNLYAKPDLAQEKTGLVNGNYASGTLNIRSEKGRVRATGNVNSKQPDLVANNISIFSVQGVSTPGRPLVIYSGGTVSYPGTGFNWKPFAAFGQPFQFSSDNALDLSQLLLAAGDQLIEVEPLEDVNPAVFTDVRNYSADTVSIMLPADQRYED